MAKRTPLSEEQCVAVKEALVHQMQQHLPGPGPWTIEQVLNGFDKSFSILAEPYVFVAEAMASKLCDEGHRDATYVRNLFKFAGIELPVELHHIAGLQPPAPAERRDGE